MTALDDEESERVDGRVLLTPASFIRSTIGLRCVRLPTGVPTLDRATRGGFMVGKLVVLGGAPNAGKTTLAVQLAVEFSRARVPVLFLAKDEDREGVLYRVGQMHALALDDLENDVEGARERLAGILDELPTLLVRDQDDDGTTLEQAEAELVAVAGDAPAVLIADSLQTIRADVSAECTDKRTQVQAIAGALKRIAKSRRWVVIATCELARGAYRSNDARDRISDLAAFKESGDIEYAATVAIVLRSVAGERDLVDVTMPKVKRGSPEPFRLELNRARARFREVPLPDAPTEPTPNRFDALKEKILDFVRDSPDSLESANAIHARIGGTRQQVLEAVRELLAETRTGRRRLVRVAGRLRVDLVTGSGGSEPVRTTPLVQGGSGGSPPLRGEPPNRTSSAVSNRAVDEPPNQPARAQVVSAESDPGAAAE